MWKQTISQANLQPVRLLGIGWAGGWACWKPLFRLVKVTRWLVHHCEFVMLEAASCPCRRTAGLWLADQPSPPSQCSSSERDAGRAAASLSRQRPWFKISVKYRRNFRNIAFFAEDRNFFYIGITMAQHVTVTLLLWDIMLFHRCYINLWWIAD